MAENKYISVNYELFIEQEGEPSVLVEKTSKDHYFNFVTEMGFTLPDFEAKVKTLNKGDKFDFIIPKEKAYGEYDESKVKALSKDIFRGGNGHFDAETIYPGNVIPMVNAEGMRFDGLVKEVGDNTVTIDFNHALAGMNLHFRGEIIDSHDATPDEISSFVNEMTGNNDGGCGSDCHGHCGGECGQDHDHDKCCRHHHHHEGGEGGCGHCH